MTYKNIIPMQHWCEDDKPDTKILLKGKASMSNAELLSLIISRGSRGMNSLELARTLLNSCKDNLGEIAKLAVSDLTRISSITPSQATRIIAAFEIGKRRNASEGAMKVKISSSRDANAVLKAVLTDKAYEEFWIILLNRANSVIALRKISEGGMSGTVVDPKKIFKTALENHASGIILGHNHPSGALTPSEADQRITRKIANAGEMLEINVLDHLIITDDGFYSFADEGIM